MATLALQIAASGDDGQNFGASTFSNIGAAIIVGITSGNVCHAFFRFTGVSGLAGATINSAALSLRGRPTGGAGTPLLKIRAEDAESPDAPGSFADLDERPLTTAGVDWDGLLENSAWNESPDIAALIQELIDGGYDPDAITIHVLNDGATGSNSDNAESFDSDPDLAATLDIDYTPAATGALTARSAARATARPTARTLTNRD